MAMAICFGPSNPNPISSAIAAASFDPSLDQAIFSLHLSPSALHRRRNPRLNAGGSATHLVEVHWTRRSCAAQCSLASRPEYVPSRISDPGYVRIFDTTLRDGEQSPGATMTSSEKLAVARLLSRLGVDIIEDGFPASSPDDLEAVHSISIEVGNKQAEDGHLPVICGLARCNKKDIDAAWEAVRHARRPRIHTFIATSEIHLRHKPRKTREEVVRIAREMGGICEEPRLPAHRVQPRGRWKWAPCFKGQTYGGKGLDDVFKRFKEVAEKKKHVSDDDIEALISNEIFQPKVIWSLSDLQVTSGTLGLSTATVKLIDSEGVERIACSVGTGPVHAAYEAVNSIVQEPVTLMEYSLNSVTEGIDLQPEC